jgi:hypothetical protein
MNPTYRIIHFRFLQGDSNNPISMRDFRALREEVRIANNALTGESSLVLESPELNVYGGYTVAIISDENTNQQYVGIAKCSPDDRFIRRVGVDMAVEQAEIALENNTPNNVNDLVRGRVDRRLVQYLTANGLIQ